LSGVDLSHGFTTFEIQDFNGFGLAQDNHAALLSHSLCHHPMSFIILFPLIAGALTAYLLGWPGYWLLGRLGVIDKPNARSSHGVPTVRGGGVSIIVTILGAIILWMWLEAGAGAQKTILAAMGGSVLVLAGVSFMDDLRSVGARLRFGCHAAAALAVLLTAGIPRTALGGNLGVLVSAGLALVGFLWIAGHTNAFNFMDGINGLAAGQAVITGLATAGLALAVGLPPGHPVIWLALATAGAAAGFFPHNFPRARMFMGDVSSAPLGFLLAALGWWLACESGWWLLLPVGLIHANFVLDTGFTLMRRVLRGERWHEPHREHFYQRLVRSGRSHAYVTLRELALQSISALAVISAVRAGGGWVLLAAVSVVAAWTLFFMHAERGFRALKP
jgi:UDP-N-acetylmuramyl pentapeptide phosphotransferase/UDP-N-acetylglucosamine-1-phosphate transferase